jgi:flagellar biosynthesis anti-sigma factor FlgM
VPYRTTVKRYWAILKGEGAMVPIRVIHDKEAFRLHAHVEVSVAPARGKRAMAHATETEVARNAPDVNAAKVQQLKAQLKNGTYRVDAGSIADAMLKEAVKNDRSPASEGVILGGAA